MPYALGVRRRYVAYFDGPGILSFTASPSHALVTSYTIRVYAYGTTSPVVTSRDIGRPTPDTNNRILHDVRSLLSPLTAGNYTATILTTTTGGTAESSSGAEFSVPLL